jgi:hypothetical protein
MSSATYRVTFYTSAPFPIFAKQQPLVVLPVLQESQQAGMLCTIFS